MNAPAQDLRWMWIAAEILLVATSVASVFMLQRIFADTSFLSPLLFTLLVGHGVLIAMRWFGFGSLASAAVSLIATVAAIVAIHYADTALAAVIPSGGSIDQLRVDMTQAGEVFQNMKTPVPPVTGFLVVSSVALWFIAVAADWAAFRLFAPGQALIPFGGLLVFVAMLGIEQDRLSTTATALVCGVLFLLAHRAAGRAAHGVWLDQGPTRAYLSLIAAGGVVAVIAALTGIVGGPAVPGADDAPLLELGDEGRQENRPLEVISPLVQIQPRLVDQSDQVLFTVESNQKAYWRIAALDVFDGNLWRSQGQFRAADDELPVDYPSDAPVDVVRSTFDLGRLNVVWAPAAYLPTEFDNLGEVGVNYEAESATFIVDTNAQTDSDGLRYTVTSQIPRFTGDLLTRLAAQSDEVADARYLDLPDDYSQLARQTARDITAGLTDPYQQALALQNWFLDNFTYDIDVAKGHDIERLEDFLTVQRGYCEQFAGTFASMARSIGLPARVATGFTWGDQDPSNPSVYLVRGRHAHAWPEVFIAGAGWVPFEPTPGRGLPNASEYTGTPENQDSIESGGEQEQETEAVPPAAAAAAESAPQPTPTPVPPEPVEPLIQQAPDPALEQQQATDRTGLYRALVILGAIALWIFGVPALKRWRYQRRIARVGTDTRRRITLSWAATVDLLEVHGHEPAGSETLQEYATRVQRDAPETYPAFGELTSLCVEAAYRSSLPPEQQAERAEALAREIKRSVESGQSWPLRGAKEIDPRPLVRIKDPVAAHADRLATGASS